MEASVLSQPAKITAIGVRAPFLRLQSDEKLIDLIRAGDEAAFEALVQRYRSRLLAFCRHMLRSPEDAEDVLQEVFAASYRAIVADEREIFVRPWLYRIARNMCLKHLGKRRPATDGGIEEMDIAAAANTVDEVDMREDLRQIVGDVRELPETQRTALLLREIDGLSYEQIASAMDTSVPGVKSLLVRARVSLAEAAEGRLMSCEVVHLELRQTADGLARLSGPARRHARHCELCGAYQSELGLSRRAAAAAFLPLAPVALVKALLSRISAGAAGSTSAGLAGGGSGAAAAGGAAGAAGGAGGAVTATLGAVGAKAAVAVATTALVAAGAADIHKVATRQHHHHVQQATQAVAPAPVPVATAASGAQQVTPVVSHTARASTPKRHHKIVTKPDSTTTTGSTTSADQLPATQAGSGTFPDTPPPTSPADDPSGHESPATDPSKQPIGAKEPVEVQGFDPGTQSGDGTSTTP
ncbi:MAG TPA: sigma-70 family RNA polymerase sigma factor [Thermoleophilaceae bacterium]|jgi:RNA polymerase sigma factor (sigma-70 family)